jgi:prepilin-type N-terminal cleavage/methylation domain-containing protein
MLSRRPGFSMVELLIVLTVLGVTAAMAFPKLSGVNAGTNVRNAQGAVAATVARARAAAIQRGRPARAYVGNGAAWTVVDVYSGPIRLGAASQLDSLFKVTMTVEGIAAPDSAFVEFDARGLGRQAGAAAVQVNFSSNKSAGNVCLRPTGRVILAACGT